MKTPLLKRGISIVLNEKELAKRAAVKLTHKMSDRKMYMAMVDALASTETPDTIQPEIVEIAKENNIILVDEE